MNPIALPVSILTLFSVEFFSQIVRYALLAGGAFLLVWQWGKERFAHRKLSPHVPSGRQIRGEAMRSLSTILIFTLSASAAYAAHVRWGWFLFEEGFEVTGLRVLQLVLLIVLHDAYFYWTHRALHLRWLRRFHLDHHQSAHPTPFTIYSFHPVEALIHSLFVPIAALALPVSLPVLLGFLFVTAVMNLIGHLGYELYGSSFLRSGLYQALVSATHHQQHHLRSRVNYGFYFRLWDRICGTEDPEYVSALRNRAGLVRK